MVLKFIFLVFVVLCFFSILNAQEASVKPQEEVSIPTPAGWSIFRQSVVVGSRTELCGNYSKREWAAGGDGNQLKIQLRLQKDYYRQDPLPFKIKPKRNDVDGTGGQRHALKVDDGWIVGFDRGEFGGSLWWFSPDGKLKKKITNGNIRYFIDFSGDLYVLEGLAHLGSATGSLLRLRKNEAGYRTDVVTKFDGEPYAFVKDGPDSMLVITTTGLRRVKISGEVEKLIETEYGTLYPNSMTLIDRKVVYIGMRHFVTRLIPTTKGYKEDWLVPDDCIEFAIDENQLDCVCGSTKKASS